MILSDRDIKKLLKNGTITIDPPVDLGKQLGSCSIDLRLGNSFRVFNYSQHPYFDPYDEKDMAKKMKTIVGDKSLREELTKKGRAHVKKFSWEKMAKETAEVYEDVLKVL